MEESLRVGAWRVNPAAGRISRNGETARLDARTMRLLLCLAERPGEVLSIDELLERAWSGVIVGPDSVYQAVASLRRLLGDDPKEPKYIATVPRLGYRMVASVGPWTEPLSDEHIPTSLHRTGVVWAAGAVLCVAITLMLGSIASRSTPPRSIAVLPFLDLTEGMKEEEFADGMTEELIDRLSKIPGVQVPPPTSSFYFKNKKVPVADIARSLGVSYVLDGSVRKSGTRLRVAARLVRPNDGYVIWSESYDRPWADTLGVQDEIATEVTKALKSSIG
jgi:TolB-like protein/DNA-binding winged helix-turn-helix (wHTH) protein